MNADDDSQTEWFKRSVGDPFMKELEDGTTMIVLGNAPDWVRLPAEIDPEQKKLRVIERFNGPCIKCGKGPVKILLLEDRYCTCECNFGCNFVWGRLKEGDNADATTTK